MRSLRCTETHICTHTRVNKKALCKVSVHSLRCQSLLLCCAQSLNHVRLSVTPWTVAHQAPVSMEFSMQEYWIKFAFPPPGDLPDAGIKPTSPALASGFFTTEPPGKPPSSCHLKTNNLALVNKKLSNNLPLDLIYFL